MTGLSHVPGDGVSDVRPSSSRWPSSTNKPLSFASAPAPRVLAIGTAGRWTCVSVLKLQKLIALG